MRRLTLNEAGLVSGGDDVIVPGRRDKPDWSLPADFGLDFQPAEPDPTGDEGGNLQESNESAEERAEREEEAKKALIIACGLAITYGIDKFGAKFIEKLLERIGAVTGVAIGVMAAPFLGPGGVFAPAAGGVFGTAAGNAAGKSAGEMWSHFFAQAVGAYVAWDLCPYVVAELEGASDWQFRDEREEGGN